MGMMINRRRACGGKKGLLPSGYKQIEYIQGNTYSQYIDTGLTKGTGTFTTIIDFAIINYTSGYAHVRNAIACADWSTSSHTSFNTQTHKIDVQDIYYVDYTMSIGTRYIAQSVFGLSNVILTLMDENKIVLGNVTRPTMSWTSSNQYTYLINSAHNSLDSAVIFTCRFFGFKILQNDILVRDYIPCINPNNVVGMYDLVEGKFYSSPNGNAFVAGPVI